MSIISDKGGDKMDLEKFFELLFKMYGEQENLKIEYEIFFKS